MTARDTIVTAIKECSDDEKKVLHYLGGKICTRTLAEIIMNTGLTRNACETAVDSLGKKDLIAVVWGMKYYTRSATDKAIQEVFG